MIPKGLHIDEVAKTAYFSLATYSPPKLPTFVKLNMSSGAIIWAFQAN